MEQVCVICHVLLIGDTKITSMSPVVWLQVDVAVVGSSLLSVLDRLAFEVLPETDKRSTGNISKNDRRFNWYGTGKSLFQTCTSHYSFAKKFTPMTASLFLVSPP